MNPPCLCSILASFTCVLSQKFSSSCVYLKNFCRCAFVVAILEPNNITADMIMNSSRTHTSPNAAWLGCANASDGSWMVDSGGAVMLIAMAHRIGLVLGTISLTLVQLWISDGISQPASKQLMVIRWHVMHLIWAWEGLSVPDHSINGPNYCQERCAEKFREQNTMM